jgi:hypothetical protein
MNQSQWSISPYPAAHDCAFTIVHDADDAYSLRLAPLFEVFDRYNLKLSVTAFAFWADWADKGNIWNSWRGQDALFAPRAVPLEDKTELEFYKGLTQRGHEIGLHTASDTDDTRERLIEAFEYYKSEFGSYPGIYVEHRDNEENHQHQGGMPDTPFFCTDVLNRYGPWVWIVSPSAIPYNGAGRYFDVLSTQRPLAGWSVARQWGTFKEFLKSGSWDRANGRLFETMLRAGTPFDSYAKQKYGLTKAFRRSGRREDADGNGFLEWYSDRNLDSLERQNGLALVYTHLNTRWLDRESGKMRHELEERLAAIASRNVWLATASTILDRFEGLGRVALATDGRWIKIANGGDRLIDRLTVIGASGSNLYAGDRMLTSNQRNKVVVGDLRPRETLVLRILK